MQISYIVLGFSSILNDFGEKTRSIKKPTAYVLCRAARIARPPQDASSQDSCKADTIVVPKHMQISMRRPLWRVITPYRYKGLRFLPQWRRVGRRRLVESFFFFFFFSLFLFLSLTSRLAVYRFYERSHKGQDVHGSLSLLSEDPIPSGGSPITLPWSLSSPQTRVWENLFWRCFVETHVERQQVLFPPYIFL